MQCQMQHYNYNAVCDTLKCFITIVWLLIVDNAHYSYAQKCDYCTFLYIATMCINW